MGGDCLTIEVDTGGAGYGVAALGGALVVSGALLATVWADVPVVNSLDFRVTPQRGPGQQDVRVLVGARVLAVRAALLIAVAGLLAHSVVPAVRATAASAAVQQASVAPEVAAPVPLVDAAFLDEVRARLADAFRRDDDYAYRERRTEINTNPFGRVGTGEVELNEVYPSPTPGLTYRRRLTEHGVALSDAALVRQDREYQARAAGVRRRLAADAAERAPETPEEPARPKPTTSSTCCSSASSGASCSRAGRRLW